jgi:glutamyl-tRNA reductase
MGLNDDNYEVFYDDEVVRHLFEVASGIDSLIVGDSQILGQVKEAFQFSSENNFSRAVFNKLQLATLKLGKRVISETVIGEGAITVSYAAIKLIEKYFNTLHNKKILIIGAGETAELAAVHIAEKQPKRLFVTNRTEEHGKALARKLNGEFIDFNDFKNNLYEYDVILSQILDQMVNKLSLPRIYWTVNERDKVGTSA